MLAADHGDRPLPHRPGKAGLARSEDRNQRHAERRREVNEPSIDADDKARRCMDDVKRRGRAPSMKLFDDPAQEKFIWHLREEGLGATAKVPDMPENHEGWEDSSVPPDKLGGYLRDLKKLLDKYEYVGPLGIIHRHDAAVQQQPRPL